VGRCGLQPSWRRIRQTCPGWYSTENSRSMTSATRHAVHSPVGYPKLSGPRFKSTPSRSSCLLSRSGLRPARPAFLSPRRPDSQSARAQRLTDCRCAPTRRATSASGTPFRNRSAACIRRRSNASKSRRTPAGLPMPKSVAGIQRNVTIFCDSQ
jgi:hypothetical protein